jgi:kynurenine formamidase
MQGSRRAVLFPSPAGPFEAVVDLSQALSPAMPRWPRTAPLDANALAEIPRDGYFERRLSLPEHVGTHIDAPAHFAADGRMVNELVLDSLCAPAKVLDICSLCQDDPEFALDADELERLEAEQGTQFGEREIALFRTGWDRFLDDAERYVGSPLGPPRFPGLGPKAAAELVRRGVAGIGIDTLGVEPGCATNFPVHQITLPAGLFHIEGLVNLDLLPSQGAWLVCAPLPLVGGSGSPARVFGLIPG